MGEKDGSKYALTVRRAANLPTEGWADERIAAIARTVAPDGASPAEIGMFLAVAHRYDLDPFLNEIWLVKDRGRLMVLTGRDSFLKVARRDPNYLGYREGAVYEKDEFTLAHTDDGVSIVHRINGFARGSLAGAFCVVYLKDRPPVLILRRFDDYRHLQGKDNWKANPEDMLLARVITAAHRLAFNISGLYTADEAADVEFHGDVDADSARAKAGTKQTVEEIKAKLRARKKEEKEEEIEDAEYELLPDEPAEEPRGVQLPDWDKDSRIPANADEDPEAEIKAKGQEKRDPEPVEKSSYEKAKGAYFATWNEAWTAGLADAPPLANLLESKEDLDAFRADWQDEHIGKRSASRFSEDDFRKGAAMLRDGIGLDLAVHVGNDLPI